MLAHQLRLPARKVDGPGVLDSSPVLRNQARPVLRPHGDVNALGFAPLRHPRRLGWEECIESVAAFRDDLRIPRIESDAEAEDPAPAMRDVSVSEIEP